MQFSYRIVNAIKLRYQADNQINADSDHLFMRASSLRGSVYHIYLIVNWNKLVDYLKT